jgi:hypothetical protein
MEKKGRMTRVVLGISLIFIVFTINGHAQQGADTSKPAGKQQPTGRPQIQNRFMWQVGVEVIADLSMDELAYTGPCPKVFTFKGRIYSNRAMTLHYRFIRSDDVRTIPVVLELKQGENKEITYSWEMGTNGPAAFNGWAFLQVILPTNMKTTSNVVNFKGSCTNREEKQTSGKPGQGDLSGRQQSQNSSGFPYTGSVIQPSQLKGPAPAEVPAIQQGQKGPPGTGNTPFMPAPSGQGPGNLPMPQQGQGPANMPVFQPGEPGLMPPGFPSPSVQPGQGPGMSPPPQPGQKGPVPGGLPTLPGNDKGPVPSLILIPQADGKTSGGTEK